jgi:hypothetical protein
MAPMPTQSILRQAANSKIGKKRFPQALDLQKPTFVEKSVFGCRTTKGFWKCMVGPAGLEPATKAL